MGTNSLAITSYSENQQAAFDFCLFLTTGEWGQKLADEARQIPADPTNTCNALPGAVETLLAADAPMSWCGELNTHPAWQSMRDEMTNLFAGKYATGADFCAALDALYGDSSKTGGATPAPPISYQSDPAQRQSRKDMR